MGRWMWALLLSWLLPVSIAGAQPPGGAPDAVSGATDAVPSQGPAADGTDTALSPRPPPDNRPPPALDGTSMDAGRAPFARQNRIAISLGFAFGSIALGGFETLAADLAARTGAMGPPTSGLQINAEMSARYYLPYYGLIHVGVSALYNWAESDLSSTHQLTDDNFVMEVPILVGGYYPVWERMLVYGALGPSIAFGSRSYWDIVPLGDVSDFRAEGSVGFQLLVGADLFLGPRFALGLELRYRALESEVFLSNDDPGTLITRGLVRGDGTTGTYTMDYSGVSLGLNLRLFAL